MAGQWYWHRGAGMLTEEAVFFMIDAAVKYQSQKRRSEETGYPCFYSQPWKTQISQWIFMYYVGHVVMGYLPDECMGVIPGDLEPFRQTCRCKLLFRVRVEGSLE